MSLFDESEPAIVNVYDFFKDHGLSDHLATQLVLHMLLTRTYGLEAEARACAAELNILLPYIFPDSGTIN
jgi:hypothetical protein